MSFTCCSSYLWLKLLHLLHKTEVKVNIDTAIQQLVQQFAKVFTNRRFWSQFTRYPWKKVLKPFPEVLSAGIGAYDYETTIFGTKRYEWSYKNPVLVDADKLFDEMSEPVVIQIFGAWSGKSNNCSKFIHFWENVWQQNFGLLLEFWIKCYGFEDCCQLRLSKTWRTYLRLLFVSKRVGDPWTSIRNIGCLLSRLNSAMQKQYGVLKLYQLIYLSLTLELHVY